MSNSVNKVHIIGNLTRDPEIKQTAGGSSICTIGVATNRKWKDKNGKAGEEVEFHNVIAWSKLAEICAQYLKKGSKVYFEGRLKTQTWEDNDGKKCYKTEIVAENMVMLDSRGAGGGGNQQQSGGTSSAGTPASAQGQGKDEEINTDDLNF